MSFLDGLRHRVRPVFRRGDFDREMQQEFRHHQELRAQEFAPGDTPAARARFGSEAFYMEETRRMTPLRWVDTLRQDLRYGLRNLRRAPVFTAVAVLSLAIGIGANAAIFGLLWSLVLQPLPVAHARSLALLRRAGAEFPDDAFSYAAFQSLRRTPGFTGVTALGGIGDVPIVADGDRRSVEVDAVAGNFFATIGLRPLAGRLISPDDERSRAQVVVISDALWAELFNRAPTAIGATISMRTTPFTVIGVAPAPYQGLAYPGSFETAIPLSALGLVGGDDVETTGASAPSIRIVGWLGATGNQAAAAAVNSVWHSCCATDAAGSRGTQPIVVQSIAHGIASPKFDVGAIFGRLLAELLGGAAIVLLAACANIGTLLLSRGSVRQREVAVRLSLGASRRRLATQMLVESSLLALVGAVAGLVLAAWALRLVAHHVPAIMGPVVDRVGLHLSMPVLGFTALVAVLSVLLFGAIPAWRAVRTDVMAPLKQGGHAAVARRSAWLDRGVVVAQVAIALVLLNAAGLLVATLRNLRHVDGGFAATGSLSTEFDARGTSYENTGLTSVVDGLLRRAVAVPGVRSAALALATPIFGGRRFITDFQVAGYTPDPGERMGVWIDPVTPGFFATAGIALKAGRDFTTGDGAAGQQVAIVNRAFVHQYVRDRDPLAMTIPMVMAGDTVLAQLVGVADDARYEDPRQPAGPMLYVPLAQFQAHGALARIPVLTLMVRTVGDDAAVVGPLRRALTAEVPGLDIEGPQTIEAALDASLSRETLTAEMATLFGAVALTLAAIGLYGIVSYQVAQRVREIGVRMALGSAPLGVVWMVLRQSLALVTVGVLLGVPLAFGGGKAIAAELFGLAGQSTVFVLGAGVVLMAVAVISGALPARRASRVDPLIALRAD